MLSKESVDYFFRVIDKFAANAGETEAVAELKKLAHIGLSVQEGVKDARGVVSKIRAFLPEDDGYFNLKDEECAALIATFALKQKGEVVWEGPGLIGTHPFGGHTIVNIDQPNDLRKIALETGIVEVNLTITAPKPLEEGE